MSAFSDGNRHSNFSKIVDLVRDNVLTTLSRLSPSSWDSPNLIRLSCGLYVQAPRHLLAMRVPVPHSTGGPPPILDSILVYLTNNVRHKLSCVDEELQAQRAVAASPADYASAQRTAHPTFGMFNPGIQPPRRNLRRRSLAPNRVPSTSATAPSLREPSSPSSPSQISPLFSTTDAPPPSDGSSCAEPRSAQSPRRREDGPHTPGLTTMSGRPGTSSPPSSPLSAAVASPPPTRRSLSPQSPQGPGPTASSARSSPRRSASPTLPITDAPSLSDGSSRAEHGSATGPLRREAGQPTPGLSTNSGHHGTPSPPLSPLPAVDSPQALPQCSPSPPRRRRRRPTSKRFSLLAASADAPSASPAPPPCPPLSSPSSHLPTPQPSVPCRSKWPCGALVPRGYTLCMPCYSKAYLLANGTPFIPPSSRSSAPPPSVRLPPGPAAPPTAASRSSRRLAGLAPTTTSSSAAPPPWGQRARDSP